MEFIKWVNAVKFMRILKNVMEYIRLKEEECMRVKGIQWNVKESLREWVNNNKRD